MKKISLTLLILLSYSVNAQLLFEDVATSKGVGVSYGSGFFGGGVSFCDYDNDGWDDITLSSETGETVKVYRNNNGTFQLVSMPFTEAFQTKQIIWVDIDNDGDKDFHAVSDGNVNVLYRNDGSGQFTNISSTCGLFTNNLFTFGTSWGDFNNDGFLDVFISNLDNINQNQRNYLYKNNADGTFTDVTASSGIDFDNNLTFCVAFFDYNNDGNQDIYLANDRNSNPNKLYRNNGDETFTDVSVISNTDVLMSAMSTTIDDYNNDGWLDIYITNTNSQLPSFVIGNALLKNNGDGTFTNVADITETTYNSFGWGAVFLDADLNSDKDLYVSGPLDGSTSILPSAFYENDGDDTFTIPSNIGFQNDTRISYSNAVGDFNNDGKPDIVVLNEDENIFLWENKSTNTGNYLKVKLEGTQSNKDGIGSWIEVSADGKVQYSYTLCGEGYLAQNSNTEIIGVGNATNIDYVKVTWLSGVVDIFTNVTPNQTLTIVEESSTLSSTTFNNKNFKVIPNPTQGEFVINSNNINENSDIKIVDLTGRIIYKDVIFSLNKTIDLSNHPDGIYNVVISNNTSKEVIKIVKY